MPLKHINYNVQISNAIARVEITQLYQNARDNFIETEYYFSISPDAAFIELSAVIDDRKILGVVKEKQQAKQEYQEAVQQGRKAAFAEIVEEVHDVMKLQLGNLGPNEKAEIKLVYLQSLDVMLNKFWKFSIGNTFSSHSIQQPNPSQNSEDVCNPHTIPSSSPDVYLYDLHIKIVSPTAISFLKSPTH